MKTLCTDEMIKGIVDTLESGLTNQDACIIAGIDESTFYNWMKWGESEIENRESNDDVDITKEPYVKFFKAVKSAIPNRKKKWVANIEKVALNGNWQASAWLLERIHYEEFGRKDKIKVETWQDEVIELIKNGQVHFDDAREEFGDDLAKQLFSKAGVDVS